MSCHVILGVNDVDDLNNGQFDGRIEMVVGFNVQLQRISREIEYKAPFD